MNEEPKLRPSRGHEIPQPRRPEGARVRRGEDPLAELARLIGQEDPFANFEGGARPPAPRTPAGNGGDARTARREPYESRDRAEPRRPLPPSRPQRDDELPDRARRDSDTPTEPFRSDRVASVRDTRSDHRQDGGREAPRFTPPRPRADVAHATAALARPQPVLARADRDDDEDERQIERPRETEVPRFARRDVGRDGPDEQYKRTRVTEYDPEYADEADLPAHGDEIYDEEPRKSRRGLAVVAGVIGLAVLGTGGFFGYRAFFGADGGPPPTIRADSAPVKVTPQGGAKQAEPPGGKQIYERLGGPPPANERIVPREERPVELNQPSRVVTTPVPPAGPVPQPQQPAAVSVQPALASTEPRRVRTVSVRADGTIVADQASRITPQRPVPQPPLAVNAYANQPAEEPEPPAQPRQERAPAPQAQGANQQPWSIVEPPRPQTRTAARSNTPVETGGFVVQVNSQKTEAEAQAAWRQMQSRFPTVLGSRQANIRRVDLGDRGVFYRAMLGPFASRDAASEVCQSLKTAGGDCIVQRN